MKPWLLGMIPVLALLALRTHAACVPVDVRYDATMQAVEATVALPEGVDSIALRDLAPYHRTKLWTSPDGSARIGETSLAPARPGQRVLHLRMDVRADAPMKDRAYAPYLRFADGTVAVYSPLFLAAETSGTLLCPRWTPPPGEQVIGYGRAQTAPLATDMAHAEGYVVFGHPEVLRHGGLVLVSDRRAPAWIRERIAAQAPALVDRYTRAMGPATVPMLMLYTRPTPAQAHDFRGDHLDASITLGLFGATWDAVDEATADQLTRFLAHELFHSWDGDAVTGSPEGEALLAKEGGADLAKIFATATMLKESPQAVLDAVAQAYNACLLELPAKTGVAAALAGREPGKLPYDCGVPLMYALAVAADRDDPGPAYFRLWRTLREAHRRHPTDGYRWQDLIPATIAPAVRADLARAIAEPGAYPVAMRAAWSALGLDVRSETLLDAATRRAWAGKLMGHLMAQDCGGSISFWNNPGGILLDSPLPRCRTLRPGATVTSILGQALERADMQALTRQVRALCAKGNPVTVGYAAGAGRPAPAVSPVRCTAALPDWSTPVRLIAPAR
ncbi:MAG: hypothetical protein B7X39_10045 [Lysobacterales bacterium 14-68-21]|nr:MAG: hypothetical protein B7X45_08895 [Xanthomonadales bacterium 15-68-25]OZB66457.1 MAG: hypothetical protein B7X39_10045 [Xanthomonadales bacterium 14-68-21]